MKTVSPKIKPQKEIFLEPEVIEHTEEAKEIRQFTVNIPSLLSILAVIFITAYITFDFFVFNPTIKDKIDVVNKRFDSLELFLDTKIPQIDNAIKIQEKQLKDLQDLSSNYID